MKTYGYYLILHILGLTGLIAAGVLAMLHGLWFCTIICGLLLVGICYSLYRIQIRQTETMYRLWVLRTPCKSLIYKVFSFSEVLKRC